MAEESKKKRTRHGAKRLPNPPKKVARTARPRSSWFSLSLPELHPVRPKRDALWLALLFIAVFVLYALSTPRTVMLEDDGLFITVARFAGVAHPPGYPLYVLLGWLASHVPVGSVAFRVHSLSGLMGALTCACIAWLVVRRTGNRAAACIAGAALAVSEHFWSQAILADVYTTNSAVLFLILALVQEAAARRETWLWVVAAVLYGLGLACHYPLLILGSPVLFAYVLAARKDFWRRVPYLVPLALFTAALLYGWMVWRSQQSVPINFLGPIESWSDFLAFVGRRIYVGVDKVVTAGFIDKLSYARYFVTQALLQFSIVGGLVAIWGAFVSVRKGWRLGFLCEVLALFGSSLLLIAMLDINYEPLKIAIFRPYPLVAYGIFSLWLGYGVHALSQKAQDKPKPVLVALYAASGIVVAALCVWNGNINYRPHDTFAAEQAQAALDFVEQDGVLIVHADGEVLTTAYLHWVEGQRPDIRILQSLGLVFNDRIVRASWSKERQKAAWAEFLGTTARPVYYLGTVPEGIGLSHQGFAIKAETSTAPGTVQVSKHDAAREYFKKLIAMPESTDAWVTAQRNFLIGAYGSYLGLVIRVVNSPTFDERTKDAFNEHIKEVLPLAENNYWALISMTRILSVDPRQLQIAEAYLQKAKQLASDDRSKRERAAVPYLEGMIERNKGNADKARALFLESLRIDWEKSNNAHEALRELVRRTSDRR